jgi:hypothetical protein
MSVVMTHFVQGEWQATDEFREITSIADALRDHLNTDALQVAIKLAHSPRAASSLVQATFQPFAAALGFRNEATGLFRDYEARLRPDYYRPVGDTGILLEVERGKTLQNNMDMLDFWKCHLCASAHYLFLLVPQDLQHGETGAKSRPYTVVTRRLARFFEPRNYTNVRGLFVFGY